jgi:hypothetical protein
LRDLKLAGFALALEEQLAAAATTALSFEERLALLVDREVHHRWECGDCMRRNSMRRNEA